MTSHAQTDKIQTWRRLWYEHLVKCDICQPYSEKYGTELFCEAGNVIMNEFSHAITANPSCEHVEAQGCVIETK
jgi:hypothetical protein